jgi:glycosyltransferase involved in cell wall biosynthesis
VKSGGLLPLDAGGKIRSFNISRELARRHDVSVFMFYPALHPDPHDGLGDPFVNVERLPMQLPGKAGALDTAGYAANMLSLQPYQIRKFCRPEVGRRLGQLVQHKQFDVLLCDYLVTAAVIPWALRLPTVIFTHNVEAVIWRRRFEVSQNPLWRLVAWREYKTIARAERRFTELADHVLTVSDDDRRSFLEFLPDDKVTTVPTGVDLEYYRPRPLAETPTLVFTGSMDWIPNEDAILHFAEEILPLIQLQVPDVSLYVVGREPSRKILALAAQNPAIRVTGAVGDIRPYVHAASAYIVPLRIGSGTRIKIFEAMAMGMPVVSTTIGAEGLPVQHGKNVLLGDTPADFAARTIELLQHRSARERMGRAARALVESQYSWSTVTNVVETTLDRVAGKHSRKPVMVEK